MNDKERKKFTVIEKLEKGEISRKEASFELQLSLKQIDRLRKVYQKDGEQGFIHKNRGKISTKKIDKNIINEIETLYLNEYYDYNLIAFYDVLQEKYREKYDISYSTLYKAFLNDDIVSTLAHKGTIKLYNERMNNAIENNDITEEKAELFQSRKILYENAHPRRSSNLLRFGEEVQMDASVNLWFGGIPSYLHLAVDKATKKVLFGWFEYEEITRAYYVLLYNTIINYGVPKLIKTDNRNSFSNQENITYNTQFGRVCTELSIQLRTTSVATSKSNVERENKTCKDRLIAELRHEGIVDIDEANNYINNVFIPKLNDKFSYKIEEETSLMRKNDYSELELKLIISEKYSRIIDNASSIKFNNKYYVPVDPDTGEVMSYMRKTECEVIITYDYEYWCKIEDNYYMLVELASRDETMIKENKTEPKETSERKKYVPPLNHPWRKNMFVRH